MMTFKKTLATGLILATLAGASWTFMKGSHGGAGYSGGMPGGGQAMPVPAIVVTKEQQRIWHSYAGRLIAVDYVELRPQVSGKIDSIEFEDGAGVEKDEILFVIDPRPYEANAAEASAALAAAQSQYDLAEKELKRAEDLIKTEAIAHSVLDERRNAAVIAKNALDGARALVAKAELDLDHAYLKAPISGRVSRPEVTVGNLVQAGPAAPLLTTIVSDDGIYADFEIDEQTYLNSIRSKASGNATESDVPVQIVLNDGRTYNGRIKSFDNHIDISTGTIRVRAFFPNEDGALLPGMYVSIKLGDPAIEDVILLTEKAIGTDQNRKFVYVVENGAATYREVTLGASMNGSRIISSGLSEGDTVITEGTVKIQPGMPVSPQTDAQPTANPVAATDASPLPATAPASGEQSEDLPENLSGEE